MVGQPATAFLGLSLQSRCIFPPQAMMPVEIAVAVQFFPVMLTLILRAVLNSFCCFEEIFLNEKIRGGCNKVISK